MGVINKLCGVAITNTTCKADDLATHAQNMCGMLQEFVEEKDSKNAALQLELNEAQEKLYAAEKECEMRAQAAIQEDATIAENDATIAENDATIAENDATIAALQRELSNVETEHKKQLKEVEQQLVEMKRKRDSIVSFKLLEKHEATELIKERDSALSRACSLAEHVVRLETEVEFAREKWSACDAKLKNAAERRMRKVLEFCETSDTRVAMEAWKVRVRSEKMQHFEAFTLATAKENEDLKARQEQLVEQYATVQMQLQECLGVKYTPEETRGATDEEPDATDKLKAQLAEAQAQLCTIMEEERERRAGLDEVQEEIQKLQVKYADMVSAYTNAEQETELARENAALVKESNHKAQTILEQETMIDALRKGAKQRVTELTETKAELEKTQAKLDATQAKLDATQAKLDAIVQPQQTDKFDKNMGPAATQAMLNAQETVFGKIKRQFEMTISNQQQTIYFLKYWNGVLFQLLSEFVALQKQKRGNVLTYQNKATLPTLYFMKPKIALPIPTASARPVLGYPSPLTTTKPTDQKPVEKNWWNTTRRRQLAGYAGMLTAMFLFKTQLCGIAECFFLAAVVYVMFLRDCVCLAFNTMWIIVWELVQIKWCLQGISPSGEC